MYRWNGKKPGKKVHILGEDNRTLCNVENAAPGTARRMNQQGEEMPQGRMLCGMCHYLSQPANQVEFIRKKKKDSKQPDKSFYQGWEWAKLRFEVLKAYGAVCMLCRATENIVVDHIKPRAKFPELQLDFDNLQVLCDFCNRGKSNTDYTDFRPKCPAPELAEPEMQHLKDILGIDP